VFHFNKGHLQDPALPMWIIMAKGQTYYVDHVTATLPWSTKETPSNLRTKGAIKFKNCLIQIFDDNCAEIMPLTSADQARIRHKAKKLTRITIAPLKLTSLKEFIAAQDLWHGPFKLVGGRCGSTFHLADVKETDLTLLSLQFGKDLAIIAPNNPYFKLYDDDAARTQSLNQDDYADLYESDDSDD
jgi:hypothetical protein